MKQLTVHYCGWRVADETDLGCQHPFAQPVRMGGLIPSPAAGKKLRK